MLIFFTKLFYKVVLFLRLYKVKVSGVGHIPIQGAVIIAANHHSFLDPQLIWHFSPRLIYPIAAKWLFKVWWVSWILKGVGCIPINGSSHGAVAALKEGKAVLIFPEGRCTPFGQVSPTYKVHKGVAVMALKTGAPVIPTYIGGTYEAWPVGKLLPRLFKTLTVSFGEPISFNVTSADIISDEILYYTTNRIMSAISNIGETVAEKRREKNQKKS